MYVPWNFVQFIIQNQQMHNMCINNILCTISIPTCFNAPASPSWSLNFVLC